MKVVIDPSVYVTAFATHGLCSEIVQFCLESTEVLVCEGILSEVIRILEAKLELPVDTIREIESLIRANATCVSPVSVDPKICRDQNDLMVLGAAEAGLADCIVTGDKDLLVLQSHRNIEILSPRAFWQKTRG